jgi:hypothetical protein
MLPGERAGKSAINYDRMPLVSTLLYSDNDCQCLNEAMEEFSIANDFLVKQP